MNVSLHTSMKKKNKSSDTNNCDRNDSHEEIHSCSFPNHNESVELEAVYRNNGINLDSCVEKV